MGNTIKCGKSDEDLEKLKPKVTKFDILKEIKSFNTQYKKETNYNFKSKTITKRKNVDVIKRIYFSDRFINKESLYPPIVNFISYIVSYSQNKYNNISIYEPILSFKMQKSVASKFNYIFFYETILILRDLIFEDVFNKEQILDNSFFNQDLKSNNGSYSEVSKTELLDDFSFEAREFLLNSQYNNYHSPLTNDIRLEQERIFFKTINYDKKSKPIGTKKKKLHNNLKSEKKDKLRKVFNYSKLSKNEFSNQNLGNNEKDKKKKNSKSNNVITNIQGNRNLKEYQKQNIPAVKSNVKNRLNVQNQNQVQNKNESKMKLNLKKISNIQNNKQVAFTKRSNKSDNTLVFNAEKDIDEYLLENLNFISSEDDIISSTPKQGKVLDKAIKEKVDIKSKLTKNKTVVNSNNVNNNQNINSIQLNYLNRNISQKIISSKVYKEKSNSNDYNSDPGVNKEKLINKVEEKVKKEQKLKYDSNGIKRYINQIIKVVPYRVKININDLNGQIEDQKKKLEIIENEIERLKKQKKDNVNNKNGNSDFITNLKKIKIKDKYNNVQNLSNNIENKEEKSKYKLDYKPLHMNLPFYEILNQFKEKNNFLFENSNDEIDL